VVDDEASVRYALRHLFEREGYTVFEAVNGADALRVLADEPVDLATVDLKMPHIDGLKLLQRMQQIYPDIKAVVITGVDEVVDLAERERNVIKTMRKPFEIKDLAMVVREELERGQEKSD
jgi:two-component system response regulator (stage 0 sporulation protein F)